MKTLRCCLFAVANNVVTTTPGAGQFAGSSGQFAGSSGAADPRRKQVNVVEPGGHKPKPTSKKKVPQHADLVS